MENENNEYKGMEVYNTDVCMQDDFDYFASRLDRVCPDIDVEIKIGKMLGWE